jgi:hypothetical protein
MEWCGGDGISIWFYEIEPCWLLVFLKLSFDVVGHFNLMDVW